MNSILVVEDNAEMKIILEAALHDQNCFFCDNLAAAKRAIAEKHFQLMILDIGLPDGDGLKFLSEFTSNKENNNTPVMIVSGQTETAKKVMAFSVGAEDFISKPFDPIELRARVDAKLKRSTQKSEDGQLLKIGDLSADVLKQQVWIQNKTGLQNVELTSREFRLLLCFMRSPERVFSRNYLLDAVWGQKVNITDRTVDAHIGHLRQKLITSKVKIDTVIGSGYRLLAN